MSRQQARVLGERGYWEFLLWYLVYGCLWGEEARVLGERGYTEFML